MRILFRVVVLVVLILLVWRLARWALAKAQGVEVIPPRKPGRRSPPNRWR
jgi:hypothetical protein